MLKRSGTSRREDNNRRSGMDRRLQVMPVDEEKRASLDRRLMEDRRVSIDRRDTQETSA